MVGKQEVRNQDVFEVPTAHEFEYIGYIGGSEIQQLPVFYFECVRRKPKTYIIIGPAPPRVASTMWPSSVTEESSAYIVRRIQM